MGGREGGMGRGRVGAYISEERSVAPDDGDCAGVQTQQAGERLVRLRNRFAQGYSDGVQAGL